VLLNKKLRLQLLLQQGVFLVLFLAAVGLAAYLSQIYQRQWDLTQNAHNSITEASRNLLKQLAGPVTITAYATQQDPRLGDLRKLIREFFTPYQRAKADFNLKFVDPAEQPQVTRAAAIQVNGELVVQYQGRSEHLTSLNEQSVANLLMRLARSHERLVFYLDGHGERKLDGVANHDLGDFGKQLQTKGFKLSSLSLGLAQDVPTNAALLVIASPQVDVLPGEVVKLKRYLEKGGNLLWLIDPEPIHGLQPLVEQLHLLLSPGTVVDPSAQEQSAPPTWALGAAYPQHPITQNFNLITVFPFARQVTVDEAPGWHTKHLLEVAPRGWVETGKLDGSIAFNEQSDPPGPVTIGVALERTVEDKQQRVVVVGNGAFLANSFLGNGGNADLGINIINWLSGDTNLITVQPRSTLDNSLKLTRTAALTISIGFLFVLPLALTAVAVAIWWRRRRL
jgi:ABC-type uncharacterized transport system involved in gliding motility auxiliary subunit